VKLWPLGLYRVAGHSMIPTYAPGDLLLGLRWFRPRVGDVLVLTGQPPLIKRLTAITPEGLVVSGDNASDSHDSRHFGPVAPGRAQARIIAKVG
jgi:phage repressor protein C with HTH and peptisase S24 domain